MWWTTKLIADDDETRRAALLINQQYFSERFQFVYISLAIYSNLSKLNCCPPYFPITTINWQNNSKFQLNIVFFDRVFTCLIKTPFFSSGNELLSVVRPASQNETKHLQVNHSQSSLLQGTPLQVQQICSPLLQSFKDHFKGHRRFNRFVPHLSHM